MTPEEHVEAVENAHREHEERMRGIVEWQVQMLKGVLMPFLTPQVAAQDQKEVERAIVRRQFVESCEALATLACIKAIKGDENAERVAKPEVKRFQESRQKLLAIDEHEGKDEA